MERLASSTSMAATAAPARACFDAMRVITKDTPP